MGFLFMPLLLTASEYSELRAAYIKLLKGERVVSTTTAGKTIEYYRTAADIATIEKLLEQYEASAAGRGGTLMRVSFKDAT